MVGFKIFFLVFLGECSKSGSFKWFSIENTLGALGVKIIHHFSDNILHTTSMSHV